MYRAYDIFEVMPDGSTIKRATVSGLEFAKLSLEELSGRTTNEWIAADRYTHQIVAQMNVPLAKRSTVGRKILIGPQGERIPPAPPNGTPEHVEALRHWLQNHISLIVNSCDDAIIAKTLDGIIVAWNPAAERMYGYTAAEVLGKHVNLLFPPENGGELAPIMERIRRGERVEHYETVCLRKDGSRIDVSVSVSHIIGRGGKLLGASAIVRDVTEGKRSQQHIQYLAMHDSLTGLANYGVLMEALEAELRRSERTGHPFSVLLLDLDGLKAINDHFGHLIGSRALCRLARILQCHCRSIDTAARYGGDEFALLLVETEKEAALRVAERIVQQLAADDEKPALSVSVGLSAYPHDGRTTETLLATADRVLYERKSLSTRNATSEAIDS